MKLFSYVFNGSSDPARISVGASEEGGVCMYFPGVPEPLRIIPGQRVAIDISDHGLDRAIRVDVSML